MIDTDILFAIILMGCVLWTFFYLLFAGHYFVATIIDSAAGLPEVAFSAESIIDRLWRIGLCVWVLFFWSMLGTFLLAPLLTSVPMMYLGIMPVLLWVLFPLSILSVLYSQNWLFMLHPKLVWHKLQYGSAFAYVHGVTLLFALLGGVLIALVVEHSFFWAMPASFLLPAMMLLYARLWGRFAWLALFSERPRKAKKNPEERIGEEKLRSVLAAEPEVPEVEVEEFNPEVEGVREGLPPTFPSAVHAGTPTSPDAVAMAMPAAASSTPAPLALATVEEEEDEFHPNKKPYAVIEPASPGMEDHLTISIADSRPTPLSEYYDQQHREEQARKRRAARDNPLLPSSAGDPPTFQSALVHGVWDWLIYPTTLQAWGVMIALTIVELFFIAMVVRNWPDNNNGG